MRGKAIIGLVFLLPMFAPAAVLDFEGLTAGTFLTNDFQASDSIVFLQNARVHFLGGNHATSGVLGLFNGGADISAEFRLPDGTAAVTDLVSVKGDLIPIAGNVTLSAYDLNGSLLGSHVVPDSPAPAALSFEAAGIHRIVLSTSSGTVAFDDLTFNTPVGGDTPTLPEPGSALLLLSGLVVAAARRRLSL